MGTGKTGTLSGMRWVSLCGISADPGRMRRRPRQALLAMYHLGKTRAAALPSSPSQSPRAPRPRAPLPACLARHLDVAPVALQLGGPGDSELCRASLLTSISPARHSSPYRPKIDPQRVITLTCGDATVPQCRYNAPNNGKCDGISVVTPLSLISTPNSARQQLHARGSGHFFPRHSLPHCALLLCPQRQER